MNTIEKLIKEIHDSSATLEEKMKIMELFKKYNEELLKLNSEALRILKG